MTKYYAASTAGFYDSAIHGASIPPDAVNLTDAAYRALLAGLAAGKTIALDLAGAPALIDPPDTTTAQLWAAYQAAAQAALGASDTSMLRIYEAVILGATTLDAADVVTFVQWRQALRAILSAAQPEDIPTALPTMPAYPVGTGTPSPDSSSTTTTTTEAHS